MTYDTIGYIITPGRSNYFAVLAWCNLAGDIITEKPDFDNMMPWSGMYDVIDSMNNIFVKIPKYWYRVDMQPTGRTYAGCPRFLISNHEQEGFQSDGAAFKYIDGTDIDYFLVGKYRGRKNSDNVIKSNNDTEHPTGGISFSDYVSFCEANGDGYHLQSMAEYCAVIQLQIMESLSFKPINDVDRADINKCHYRGIEEWLFGIGNKIYSEWLDGMRMNTSNQLEVFTRDGQKTYVDTGIPYMSGGYYYQGLRTDDSVANYFVPTYKGSYVTAIITNYFSQRNNSEECVCRTDCTSGDISCGALAFHITESPNYNNSNYGGRLAKTPDSPSPPEPPKPITGTGIISFNCDFGMDGQASATLVQIEKISIGIYKSVQIKDNVLFVGIVTQVTQDDKSNGYTHQLSDPLSCGYYNEVTWVSGTDTAITDLVKREDIIEYCEQNDLSFAYSRTGVYYVLSSADKTKVIPDDGLISYQITEGNHTSDYFNALTVTGSAEKEVAASQTTKTYSVGDITVTETMRGERPILRTTESPDENITETWAWDEETNVNTDYENTTEADDPNTEESPDTRTVTSVTVSGYNREITQFTISNVVDGWEMAMVAVGSYPNTSYQNVLTKVLHSETTTHRNTDGTGTKIIETQEAARNRYTYKYTTYAPDDTAHEHPIELDIPAYDFYELVPEYKEVTMYKKYPDKVISFTRYYKPRFRVKNGISGPEFSMTYVYDKSSYAFDDMEQPTMTEALEIWAANVEYTTEWDEQNGYFPKTVQLPEIAIPENIDSEQALYDWLYARAVNFSNRYKRNKLVYDQITKGYMLDKSYDGSWNGAWIGSKLSDRDSWLENISISLGGNQAQITLVYHAPSDYAMSSNMAKWSNKIRDMAQRMDDIVDNIADGKVVYPISNNRTLITIGGIDYKVDNPNMGAVWAEEIQQCYRASSPTRGGKVQT